MDPSMESGVDPLDISPDPSSITIVEPRRCSVRGCAQPLELDATTKMCSSCREKHRRYATTKRAKRKLEKAAIEGQVVVPVEQIPGSTVWIPGGSGEERSLLPEGNTRSKQRKSRQTQPLGPSQAVQFESTSQLQPIGGRQKSPDASVSRSDRSQTPSPAEVDQNTFEPDSTWSITNIDPRLFAAQPSSSELAGALTFSAPTPTDSTHASSSPNHMETIAEPLASSSNREGPDQGQDYGQTTEFDLSVHVIAGDPDERMEDSPRGTTTRRFCSIKGCKSVLEGEYSYRMCNTCRDRYRNYGVTKRKKWKAERIAFDHELEQLRRAEDERRAKEGLVPLSESPEELRTWELSIIDEKVQLPPSLAAVLSTAASNAIAVSSPYHPLAIRQLNEALRGNLNAAGISTPLDQLTPIQIAQLAQLLQVRLDRRAMVDPIPLVVESIPSSTSNPDTSSQTIQSDNASSSSLAGAMGYPPSEEPRQPAPASPDNSQQLLESPSEATSTSLPVSASTLVLPQRMCTVSHCHTILPGHYLYKRCDRHRLQNRKHGKLKRVREKVVKEKGPDDDGDGDEESIDADAILQDDSEPFDDEAAERQKLEAKAREKAKQLMMARLAGTRKSRAKKPRKKEAPTAISTNSQDTEQAQPEDAPLPQIIPPGPTAGSNHVVNDKRRGYSCTAPGCSNLINPYFRWRMCEPCRALRKELRLGKKAEEEKQLKEAEEAYEKLGGAVVGATEAGQGSVDPEGYEGISDMETDIPPMDNGAQMNALSPEPTLFPTLTFKPFTPRDVEVSHEDDHGTLFGVLHSPDTELQPIDDSDDFVVRGQPGGGTLDSTTDSQPANSPPHTNLPHPCPNFTPALSQSTTSAYRPRPPSVRSNGAAQKPYKFVEGSRRNKRKSEGSQANDEQRNSVESTESQSNDPPGKKQRTKSQTAKGKGKAPVQPSIQSGYSYGPTTHMPYGSYYPYMTYPPTYGHPGYAMPPGSSNSTSISTSYSYTYPGYPGYPSYYPGYPYTTGYYPPPPTGFSPSAYLTPTAPNGDVTSATKEKKAETPQNRNTEAEGSTDLSISTESHSEDQPEPATNDTPREMILDIPTDNEQHPSPQTSFSAAPSPASTNTSLGIIRVVSRNKKGHSNTLAKKGSRDIFTNFTPELVRDNQGKRPKRSAPLFENAEERLKQIQASLARSNSDPEQMSPAESSSSSSPGLRMMFYRPRVEESVDIQKEVEDTPQQPRVTHDAFIAVQPSMPSASPPCSIISQPTAPEQKKSESRMSQTRTCRNKTCQRTIPGNVSGWLCDRCRAKIKHRQAKTKQRFKLEPLKKVTACKKVVGTAIG